MRIFLRKQERFACLSGRRIKMSKERTGPQSIQVTTRGLGTEEMKQIASCIGMTARDFEGTQAKVHETVAAICEKFPLYG